MVNIIKKAVFNLIEKTVSQGQVQDIRLWNPSIMYEIDLYLPTIDMSKWNSIQRLKCKVDEFEWRDYTPALWNAEKKVCTMYVDTDHNGAGSRWAKQLCKGDTILFGAAHAAQLPSKLGKILFLGDGSALGHLLSLMQLTDSKEYPLEAGIFLSEDYQLPFGLLYENPKIEFLMNTKANALTVPEQWMNTKNLSKYSSIYISGYTPMVTELRKKLKAMPDVQAKLFAVGFWK